MGRKRSWFAFLWLAALACGGAGRGVAEEGRVAVPPDLAPRFQSVFRDAGLPLRAVPLRPSERARDLEVLLLSSGSTAYDAYAVRATSLPLLRPWLAEIPADGSSWREDIRAALRAGPEPEWAGLPLSCDGPVLLFREGLLTGRGKGPPAENLAEFEGRLERASREQKAPVRLQTTLPPAVLLLSLAWSEAGEEESRAFLPEGPALRAVAFLQRHGLGTPAAAEEAEAALERGQADGLFCWASEADGLLEGRGGSGGGLVARPLPHRGLRAVTPFGGWTLVWSAEGAGEARRFLTPRRQRALEEALGRAGFPSVGKAPKPPFSPGAAALLQTQFRPLPLAAFELEVLNEAVADAVEAGIAPEQALRRARARLAAEGRGVP